MKGTICLCCGKEIDPGRRYKLLNGFVTCSGHMFQFTVPDPWAEGNKTAAPANRRSKNDGERRTDGDSRTRREPR